MDLDGPLDFENEDPLVNQPAPIDKRKKVIGLDDLVADFYKEKSKLIDKENNRRKRKACKVYDSDDDDDDEDLHGQEALLSKYVDDCRNQMNEISGEEDVQEWGLCMFGDQKTLTSSSLLVDIGSCCLLKEFMSNELNSMVDLSPNTGEMFLEGLLVNGLLTKLVLTCGRVETIICKWTFNLLLYSSKEELRASACDFWCSILLSLNEVEIGWLPNYENLKEAIESYGFRINNSPQVVEIAETECQGPPQNIRHWLKFVSACSQIRCNVSSIFSSSKVEKIAETVVWLLLDRGLLGLSLLLQETLLSVIGSFKEDEWVSSCKQIANSLASRVPQDMNCLRIVECVSGVDARSKYLRSSISNQMLLVLLGPKESDEKLLDSLMTIKLKDKNCNLFKTYICLVLGENWLFSSKLVNEKPVLKDMWAVFLRNCSCQINSTDLRSFASKVRTRAAYLLQGCSSN